MKKQFFKLTYLLAFITVTIVSCNKTEEPEPLTKDEAVEVLNSMGTDMEQAMTEMMSSPSMVTLTNLMVLMSFDQEYPEMAALPKSIGSILKVDTKNVRSIPSKLKMEDDGLGILDSLGTYTWNFTTYSWDYVPEPEDKLIFIFPSNPEALENDATLTVSDFEFVTSEEDVFPVSLQVTLVVGADELLALSYNANVVDSELNSLSVELLMTPFELNLGIAVSIQTNGALVTLNHEFKKENVKLMSSNLETLLEGETSFNVFSIDEEYDGTDEEEESMPAYLRGFLQFGQVKAQLDLLTKEYMLELETATTSSEILNAANTHLTITLYTYPQGSEIGDIVWQWDNEEETIVPYIQFSDGSILPLTDFLPEVFDEEYDFE